MKREKVLKITAEIFRVIIGLTFIFSGFVKSVDPIGFAIKIEEYFSAFGMPFLSFFSVPASLLLCGIEFVLGIMLILGLYRKLSSRLVLVLMVFMTILTLYIVIADPVNDCGCFGDVLIISNLQTFIKNIFLLFFSVYLFNYYEFITPLFNRKNQKYVMRYILVFTIVLLGYSYYFDSLVDFRPYRTGSYLPGRMNVDDTKKTVEEVLFIYEKDGIKKEFTSDNYPWNDTTWKFIERHINVLQKGEEPEIKDFFIYKIIFGYNLTGIVDEIDITDDVIENDNYTFLVIAPDLKKLKKREIDKFNEIYEYSLDYGYDFLFLTSSNENEIRKAKKEYFPDITFASTDEKVLITIIRSLPGLMLIKNGTVVHKWSRYFIPGKARLSEPLENLSYSIITDAKNKNIINIIIIFIILFIPLLIIKILELYKNKSKFIDIHSYD